MIERSKLRIAVVAEDSLQQHRLRSAMEDFGCEVLSLSPQTLERKGLSHQNASAWLVDLRDDHDLLDEFFELEEPVLLGFEAAPVQRSPGYPRWEKNLYHKLKTLLGQDLIQSGNDQTDFEAIGERQTSIALTLPETVQANVGDQAKHVWVLGSSLGGPEAIKLFLDALPEGLPVGFVYGQHIDQSFVSVLAQVLGRHSHFSLKVAEAGSQVKNGEVLVVPTDREMQIVNHEVRCLDRPWPGPYGPSVDQLMLNVYQCYPNLGVILFSGMGNDGAESAQALGEKGVTIWAQSTETCVSSAMPDSARETGAVNFSGSPQALAQQLVSHIQKLETQTHPSSGIHHAAATSTDH